MAEELPPLKVFDKKTSWKLGPTILYSPATTLPARLCSLVFVGFFGMMIVLLAIFDVI